MVPPPLIGDEQGRYRVHVVGNCGKSPSTVGKELARILDVPFITLDALFWKPGWVQSTNDEMRERVEKALDEADGSWVVDGNYRSRIGSIVEDNCTDVIWLDPPLALYFPRLITRTFLGLLCLRKPCSPGCPEMVMNVHWPVREREGAKMALIGLNVGSDVQNQKMRRLGGWGGELRAWKAEVQRMVDRK
ncbi:hypothetical protein C8J57DRAFT_1300704 [Mycena rebaudengoi]|nr:hypothetical protein C8J57DRAFT_1300704 [Mycena rebaudengoi]